MNRLPYSGHPIDIDDVTIQQADTEQLPDYK